MAPNTEFTSGKPVNLRARLVKHNKEKEFWERALVLISRTNSLTQTHAMFLEWYCLQAAKKAGRYADENGNSASKPPTPAPLEADCLEIFDTGRALLATLGYPVFDRWQMLSPPPKRMKSSFARAPVPTAAASTPKRGSLCWKDSIGRKQNVPSIIGTAKERFRLKLLESGVLKAEGDAVLFTKDHLFRSPSMAAVALVGRRANGWLEWKSKDGETLDALKRQAPIE